MNYKVLKVLNNNAVLLEKENGVAIGMGHGIGFGKKTGSSIDQKDIIKLFENTDNQFMTKLSSSINKLNEKYYPLVDKIIQHISDSLHCTVNDNLYLALAEHISFAETRLDKNYIVPCPMEPEIRVLYPQEYHLAEEVVGIIEKDLNRKFPKSEIGLIALHILNTTLSTPKDEVVERFQLVMDIVEIIEKHYNQKLDESSLEYTRLLTHLNFLSNRIFLGNKKYKFNNISQNIFFNTNCKDAITCSDQIKKYIKEKYGYELHNDEVNYLIIHVQNCMGGIGNDN